MDEQFELTPQQRERVKQQAIALRSYRASIRLFIKDKWGLIPQGVKPEYQEQWDEVCRATHDNWERLKKTVTGHWFGDPIDPKRPDLEWVWYDFKKGTHFTWHQSLILMGIEKAVAGDAKRLLSAVSGHGCGKSATCSWIIIWFLYCFYESQVPVTAPTSHQMHDVLWKELSIWINRMPQDDKDLYYWTSDYVRMAYAPNSWFARARTSTKENTEAIAGVHAEHVCIVADESSGVPQQVFDTAEGALTSGNVLLVMISNGTQATGYFHASHHEGSGDYQNFQFNGEESPIVDRAYIALKAKHGFKSEEYKIRVKGGFPGENMMDDSGYLQLIPLSKINVRPSGEFEMPFMGRKILGVDPSGEGRDACTFVIRDRFKAKVVHTIMSTNDKEIAEVILTLIDRYALQPEDVVIGSFGTGSDTARQVALATKDMKAPYEIYAVMEGNSPKDEERDNPHLFARHEDELTNPEGRPTEWVDMYMNIRALMYFRARDWLIRGGYLIDANPESSDFAQEFVVQRYKRSLQGNKIQMMPKKDMVKLRIKSPNKADALALTFLRDIDDSKKQQEENERALEEINHMEHGDEYSVL